MTSKRELPDRAMCAEAAALLKALGHRQRLFILCCLKGRELTVSELERLTGASQPVISQHLSRMRLEGVVASRRDGNCTHYRIASPTVITLMGTMKKVFKL